MATKWVCNLCGFERNVPPERMNQTCTSCGKGRWCSWNHCKCGKWFHADRTYKPFCGTECFYKYRRMHNQKGIKHPDQQRARIGICLKCGKEFRAIKDFKRYKQKYCGKACWSHRSNRPQGFNPRKQLARLCDYRRWRKAVLARDEGRCVICGSDYHLEVDHILPVVQHPELILDISNGRTLCRTCHKGTESYGKWR